MGFFDFLTEEIAIDLGTANTLIIHNDKVVIDSPSIVARDRVSGKIIAVGTSTVRALETIAISGFQVTPKRGWTDKFIYPPYEYKMVDKMITNFHTPQSTLLMMVSAFADRKLIKKAYNEAKKNDYRFLSYGDAMIII